MGDHEVIILSSAELSKLARIAMNPNLATRKDIQSLKGYAAQVANVLIGGSSTEHATKTAKVITNWVKRQGNAKPTTRPKTV